MNNDDDLQDALWCVYRIKTLMRSKPHFYPFYTRTGVVYNCGEVVSEVMARIELDIILNSRGCL